MFCSENCSQNFTACSIAYKKSFRLSQELASKIYFQDWFCLLSLWVPVQKLVVMSAQKSSKGEKNHEIHGLLIEGCVCIYNPA